MPDNDYKIGITDYEMRAHYKDSPDDRLNSKLEDLYECCQYAYDDIQDMAERAKLAIEKLNLETLFDDSKPKKKFTEEQKCIRSLHRRH